MIRGEEEQNERREGKEVEVERWRRRVGGEMEVERWRSGSRGRPKVSSKPHSILTAIHDQSINDRSATDQSVGRKTGKHSGKGRGGEAERVKERQ